MNDKTLIIKKPLNFWFCYSYFLKGERAGQSDVIVQNLPGYPDNIKLNSRGNFYVGLGSVRYQGVSLLGPFLDLIGPYPAIKRFLTKVQYIYIKHLDIEVTYSVPQLFTSKTHLSLGTISDWPVSNQFLWMKSVVLTHTNGIYNFIACQDIFFGKSP